jgi:hypothetical protein
MQLDESVVKYVLDEYAVAGMDWWRFVQERSFHDDINHLNKSKIVKSKILQNVLPFLDSHGILRVKGRLQKATYLTDETKNLLILDGNHEVLQRIITLKTCTMGWRLC